MRDIIGPTLVTLGQERSDFFVVDADNGPATRIRPFGEAYSSRYVNVGCAEQNLLGVSAGISLSGVPVIASTFSVFLLGRAYDQIRNTIAASHLPVILLGTHAGLSTGADGGSHCCPEDLALMRALPDMQIFIPACSGDIEPMIRAALNSSGPSYIRVPRSDLWPTPPETVPILNFGKEAVPRCWLPGKDIALISAGLMLPRVLAVAALLSKSGVSPTVYDLPNLNLNKEETKKSLQQFKDIVTVEDHWQAGGIGELIASTVADLPTISCRAITAEPRFPSSGQVEEVLDDMGLSVERIQNCILDLLSL